MKPAFLTVLTLASLACASLAAQDKPNILFILADDVGCETLGCYGGSSYRTPRLDQLAASGTRFRHCYSMPVCHPTRICLLTGRYPFRLQHPRWGSFPNSAENQSLAHVMKSAGYATAVAGKWQLAMLGRDLDHPRKLGFDEYSLFGWHEGPRYYEPHIWQNGKLRTDVKDQFGPDVYTDFLIDFIKRKQGQPFFAFYSMALCHDVTDDLKSPVPFGPGKDQYDSYKEMIESMDRCVGRLTAALDRLKLRDKTLVVFTTDNGTPVSSIARVKDGKRLVRDPVFSNIGKKRVRGGKGKLTNAGTNVPLIVSWPGHAKAGTVVDDLADFSDFFVTFAELGGAALPRDVALDGQSFACRLRDNTPAPRKWAFAEGRGGKHWVRTARWKLYNDGRLFDVPNDLLEKSPLKSNALSDEAAKARAELQLALESLTE